MGKHVNWHPDFSVGDSILDAQRLELFEMVNKMWDGRKGSEKVKKQLFTKITEKLQTHFDYEESILARNEYHQLVEHKDEHCILISKAKCFLEFCDKDSKKIWHEMMAFLLHELLLDHMVNTDIKYREYLFV